MTNTETAVLIFGIIVTVLILSTLVKVLTEKD